MSIDSMMFVTCNKEDVISIGNSVTKALNTYVRDKLDSYWRYNTDAQSMVNFMWSDSYKDQSNKFTNGVSVITDNFDTFVISFGNGDDSRRSLFMFPTCSSDYSDVREGYKVIFSIGHWGSAEEIMSVLSEALKPYGDVYYDFNDCDDEDFIKL